MSLITFFGLTVKPKLTRGKGMWNPMDTQVCENGIICLRDKDVNCFLIPDGEDYIAIDSGYMNSSNTRAGLQQLGIDASRVKAVFLTHLDIDHAGGMDQKSNCLFPKAAVYLGKDESRYLTGEYSRKKVLFHRCKLPIALSEFQTLTDGAVVKLQETTVLAIYAFGHTLGHTAYLVNNQWLFSGDCIISNEEGGWCFYDFWNSDTEMNKAAAQKLKRICEDRQIDTVLTSHSGVLTRQTAFRHCETAPDWKQKGFVFCKKADFDPYKR